MFDKINQRSHLGLSSLAEFWLLFNLNTSIDQSRLPIFKKANFTSASLMGWGSLVCNLFYFLLL